MTKCPICKTEIEENQDYCKNCAWEFEYYFNELSEEERERYEDRLKIFKEVYSNKNINVKENITKVQEKVFIKSEDNIWIIIIKKVIFYVGLLRSFSFDFKYQISYTIGISILIWLIIH